MIVNGVTLPDIPADVLAKYPNALILWSPQEVGSDGYMLFLTKGEIGYLPPSILGTSNPYLMSTDNGFARYMVAYPNNATEWILKAEMENYLMRFELLDTFSPVWANLDIYECTSLNLNTGAFTKGDIWFPNSLAEPSPTRVSIGISLMDGYAKQVQRLTGDPIQINAVTMRDLLKTANGKPLPEIPADVLAKYPNAIITYTYSDSYDTYWLYASQSEFFYGDFASLGMGTGDGMGTFGLLGYYGLDKTNNVWYLVDERTGDTVEFGTFGNMTAEFVWANHNIHEMTSLDLTTMEYTLGGIYYPPQIETDNRASIGYDLFDDIVVQVQRLSGTSEKMNGITAYQKLCCVMAVEEGGNNPGEIIINGVKLPPFPEVDYPYAFIYVQDLSQYGEIVYYLQFSAEKYFYHYLNSNDGYAYAPSDYSAGTIQYQLYKSKIAEGQIWYGEEPTEAFYKDYGKSGIKWSNYDIRKDDPDTGEIVVKRTV